MAVGNKQVNDLPPIPSAQDGMLYIIKNGLDYRVSAGVANGLAFLNASAQIPASQISQAAVTQHQAALSVGWGQLTGVPAFASRWPTFDEVTSKPAFATRWPTYAEVTDKPSTFTPSAHTHAAADITSGVFAEARIPSLPISRITNLQADLDSRVTVAQAATDTSLIVKNGTNLGLPAGTNKAMRLYYSESVGDRATIVSYDYGANVYKPMQFEASAVTVLNPDAANYSSIYFGVSSSPAAGVWRNGASQPSYGGVNSLNIGTIGAHDIGFVTNNILRGKVLSNGNVVFDGSLTVPVIGPSHSYQGFQFVWNTVGPGNGRNEYINNYGGGGGGHYFYGRSVADDGLSLKAYLDNGGNFVANSFQSGSSRELKRDLIELPYGLETVEKIKVVKGKYKEEYNPDNRDRLFVIAEQLSEVVPEAVFEDSIEMGDARYAGVEYTQLVPVLIKAVQELSAKVKVLEGMLGIGEED